MTLEFLVMGHGFDSCYDAMELLLQKKLSLQQKSYRHEHVWQSNWLRVVDGLLALGEQCKRQPTANFEHYPRLAKEWALELLNNHVFNAYNEELRNECNQSYINEFDLMEYLHEYN